jgi:secernin
MCDTFAAIGAAGLVFAKNSDRPPAEPQVVRAFPARAAGPSLRTQYLEISDVDAYAFVGSQPTWLWGVEHGVNEHGVAIGNEKLYTTGRPQDRERALLGMDIVRLGLERARSADEALSVIAALVEAHGQGGSGERDTDDPYDSSFLIADARGGWIVETCDRTWAARPLGTGGAISNRISLTTDHTRRSRDLDPTADFQTYRHPKVPTTIADHRLAATTACVAAAGGDPDPAAFAAATRDHGTGPWGRPGSLDAVPPPAEVGDDHRGVTVCMHVRGFQATTASMVTAVGPTGEAAVWVALGCPCVSVFVPLVDVHTVPPLLGDAATWARFARLRDRVDAEPDALADVRAVLGPVEARLWAEPTVHLEALDAALALLGV